MKKQMILMSLLVGLGCQTSTTPSEASPIISTFRKSGDTIEVKNAESNSMFQWTTIEPVSLSLESSAPGKILASMVSHPEGKRLVFHDGELPGWYTLYHQLGLQIQELETVDLPQKTLQLQRIEALWQGGVVARTDWEMAQLNLTASRTQKLTLEAEQQEMEVRISSQGLDIPSLNRANAGTHWVVCDVLETDFHGLHTGMGAHIQFPAIHGSTFTGQLQRLGPSLDPITRTLKATVTLVDAHPSLKAGMFGEVRFWTQAERVMKVPISSLSTVQGQTYVFVVQGVDTAPIFLLRKVKVGRFLSDETEIVEGLFPGEKVVTQGTILLKGMAFGF